MTNKPRTVEVEERFNAIVEEFGVLLRRAIVRLCPHDRGLQFDDIEQEARMRLWRALKDEREVTNYASYLYRIAATATIDAMRRVQARHEEQLQLMEQGANEGEMSTGSAAVPALVPVSATTPLRDSPERVAESREAVGRVMLAVARLPDEQRRAVGMYLQGMTSQDVADLMGWTEPKSRNLIYRGLKELRKSLRDEGIEYEIE
jgi:RNA polymerase sigma-70 factor (ECF subfamily)